jgi:hypothetical protein
MSRETVNCGNGGSGTEYHVPDRKVLRKMKYLSDQQGIVNRYLAEGENWESHLENTRNFTVECLEESQPGTVALLGSGWLLDIPLDYLLKKQDAVYLIDIVHPPQIIKKAGKYQKMKIVRADLTGGGIQGAYNLVQQYLRSGKGSVLDIICQASLGGIDADFIISLNVLNQLDILLIDYISRYMDLREDEIREFRERIQEQHIGLLPAGKSCLITDVEEKGYNRRNELVSSRNLIYTELPETDCLRTWKWNFDTRDEYHRQPVTEMTVNALRF